MAKLSDLAKQTEAKRQQDFVTAAWQDQSGPELLTLANQANLGIDEADKLLVRIANARQLVPGLNKLPELRKAAAVARKHQEEVQSKNSKLIEELQAAIFASGTASQQAQNQLSQIEGHVQELLHLHRTGLLPWEVAHHEIKRLAAREQASGVIQRNKNEITAATNRRWEVSQQLESLKSQRGMARYVADAQALDAEIAHVKEQLADAERAIELATKAADDARAAMPD